MNTTQRFIAPLSAIALFSFGCQPDLQLDPKQDPVAGVSEGSPASAVTLVKLTEEKARAADIKTQLVGRRRLRQTRRLPARLSYDQRQHVTVRAVADGIVESVLVNVGDHVDADQTIAVLRCPSIGACRSKILSRQVELEIATTKAQWYRRVQEGVEELVSSLRADASDAELERILNDEQIALGRYKGELLTAFSESRVATQLSESIRDLAGSGAVSGRTVRLRQSEMHQSRATLQATIEQTLFESRQESQQADAMEQLARRNLLIARHELATLTRAPIATGESLGTSLNAVELSRFELRAPRSGTIESMIRQESERVRSGDELFVVAETSSLWAEADVRVGDWEVLNARKGDLVRITLLASPEVPLEGFVYQVGRQVDPRTGALALIAQVANPNHQLRPGMFARMEVALKDSPDLLAVPESAVTQIDQVDSVFVPSDDGYIPVAVEVGDVFGGLVEIRSGLEEGQSIVVRGVFALKSELLLESEE